MNHQGVGQPAFRPRGPLQLAHGNAIRQSITPRKLPSAFGASHFDSITGLDSSDDMQGGRTGPYRRQSAAAHYGANQQPDLELGDVVEVPGGMTGTVRYIGSVKGKSGTFAGVELNDEYAARGKNDGDVDGISYFTTSIPGSGIFLPTFRASKPDAGADSIDSFVEAPSTPISRNPVQKTRIDTPNPRSPLPPSLPSFSQSLGPGARHPFSQSIGPGARAPSPSTRLKSRPSLPRPASPTRKGITTHATSRPNGGGFRPPASPIPQRIAKPSTPIPARSQSRAQSRLADYAPDDSTPTGLGRPSIGARALSNNVLKNEETRRLQKQLEERDEKLVEQSRHLKEQADTLLEMESSLAELQSRAAASDKHHAQTSATAVDAAEMAQLRSQLREKNDKIAALTAEFDSHRTDFRDTIDALEAASTETERVYQNRVQELQQEVEDLQNNREDVEAVTEQFTQLEGLVQELEEGLDDARRSEAEARHKVEELEGELERAQLELQQEREKAVVTTAPNGTSPLSKSHAGPNPQVLAQRDDEIRGLKALVHSLSSSSAHTTASDREEVDRLRAALADLTREKVDLQRALDAKPAARTPPTSAVANFSPTSSPRSSRNLNSTPTATTAVRPFARDPDALANLLQPHTASPAPSRLRQKPYASATDSTDPSSSEGGLWCEICEASGHDVLTCSRSDLRKHDDDSAARWAEMDEVETPAAEDARGSPALGKAWDWMPSRPGTASTAAAAPTAAAAAEVGVETPALPLPVPLEDGPAAGKRSGKVDMGKWCAFCERDGHDSVDCPFEEEL